MRFLRAIAALIDRLNELIGRAAAWLTLALVVVQFVVVVMRYVFGIGSIAMQESLMYFHAALFLVAAGYTLLDDGHVRVDVFYRGARPRTKAAVNLLGSLFLLLPVVFVIWDTAWPFVVASWNTLEGSTETSGVQAIYLLKTLILVFAVLVGLQGISLAIHSLLIITGYLPPPHPKAAREMADHETAGM